MQNKKTRIEYLDGFRGIAILLVVLFHSFSRWPTIVPYGNRFGDFFIFKNGFLGVQLFFLISGFVILMTLEKCTSLKQFLIRRWLRLFPAMLIATILVFSTALLLPERPAGTPHFKDIFSGLLFIEPWLLSLITHHNFGLIEGAFWSLFVEVKFYIIFGFLYFFVGERRAIWAIFFLSLLPSFINLFSMHISDVIVQYSDKIFLIITPSHFVWFASGSFAYLYSKDKKLSDLVFSIAIALLGCFKYFHRGEASTSIAILLISTIFLLTVYSGKLQSVFKFKPLLFVGFVSYPFYLIHENALIALTIKLGRTFPNFPALLMPLLPTLFLLAIAYIIAKHLEPITGRFFSVLLERIRIYKKETNNIDKQKNVI